MGAGGPNEFEVRSLWGQLGVGASNVKVVGLSVSVERVCVVNDFVPLQTFGIANVPS
jgi:hypothetical protein